MPDLKLNCNTESVPASLKKLKCWTTWGSNPKSLKAPDPAVGHGALSFEKAIGRGVGVGVFLGGGLAGVDLDGCRNPETGEVDDWAEEIVVAFESYTEVSPSSTGLKILCFGNPKLDRKQKLIERAKGYGGKKAAVEAYSEGRYFTITGDVYGGHDKVIKVGDGVWKRLAKFMGGDGKVAKKSIGKSAPIKKGGRNNQFYKMAANFAQTHLSYEEALEIIQKLNQKSTDEPLSEEELIHVVNNGYKKYDEHAWVKGDKGGILPVQDNIISALEILECELSYDEFSDRKLINKKVAEDHDFNKLWLTIEKRWKFRTANDYFRNVCDWITREKTFHPVQDMLKSFKWDKVKRLESWLIKYGEAESEHIEYLKWISKCVLVAAVKRVFEPGCKFDEMMVIEGAQGCGKSRAIRMLCMNDDWFSDDLPLGSESKIVVERTLGKWIIEAAELAETRGNKLENLKAFLSRGSERARMAWGRDPVDRRRHFIIIGSTNDDAYLKDITGDRRFWPVKVKKFDLIALEKIREQLWAEAVYWWREGFDIRMPEKLWPFATIEQNKKRVITDWQEALEDSLNGKQGWFLSSDLREWYLGSHWHDYSNYQMITNYLKQKMEWRNGLKKIEGTAWRVWFKNNQENKIDLYSKGQM